MSSACAGGLCRPLIVLGAGIVAALNIGKLPPALAALQAEFGLSLVQVSWMVSLFMVASTVLGIFGGSLADRFDPRRVMIGALALLALAGAVGAVARSTSLLFASRALESLAFLLVVLPGPALLRDSVPVASMRGWLGAWGAYMPTGMAAGLFFTPMLMAVAGWRGVWAAGAVAAALWAVLIAVSQQPRARHHGEAPSIAAQALLTVRSPGPWLIALCFAFYAGQFTGIFSFLPSVYREYGISAQLGGTLTALAVLCNAGGNLVGGQLAQRGVDRAALIGFVGVSMGVCAWIAFGSSAGFAWRYAALIALSSLGGLIPGTLFATAPYYAPSPAAVSTTVGLMMQGAGFGQIVIPVAIAALAQYTGGWESTWIATGIAALITVTIAVMMKRFDLSRRR